MRGRWARLKINQYEGRHWHAFPFPPWYSFEWKNKTNGSQWFLFLIWGNFPVGKSLVGKCPHGDSGKIPSEEILDMRQVRCENNPFGGTSFMGKICSGNYTSWKRPYTPCLIQCLKGRFMQCQSNEFTMLLLRAHLTLHASLAHLGGGGMN